MILNTILLISILILVVSGILFLWIKEVPFALLCFFLIIPYGILLHASINKLTNPDFYQTLTIREVKEYQIDSTIVISGTDTIKTYTITYFK